MMERDWNHPCIIAYSLGNEFQSQTPEGQAWVKDMRDYVRSIDSTRLITFASFNVWRDYVKQPEDEASRYVDFVSANIYGNHQKILQRIHELYPDKPVYISEFGIRATKNKTEEDRVAYFKKALQEIRQFDFVSGASVWSFNDYQSRYSGTDADGYRAWGLVTPERQLRGTYQTLQEEFAPVILQAVQWKDDRLIIDVQSRSDFPSYTLRNYRLQCGTTVIGLKTLRPGERQQLTLQVSAKDKNGLSISIIRPGGSVVINKIFKP